MRTNQGRCFSELLCRNFNPLSALCIPAWIVWSALFASGAIECRELRRAYAPVTAFLPRHNMEMEVRCFLSAIDPVVLESKYSEGSISFDERLCDSLRRCHYELAFPVRKIEEQRNMSTSDNAALANFKLPWIDHGQRMSVLFYDLPSLFANCRTKVARIFYGEFDHLFSPIKRIFPSG
jgi:hypothetical protein